MSELKAYVYQPCSMPGCTVMIQSVIGNQLAQPVCKWCLETFERERNSQGLRSV